MKNASLPPPDSHRPQHRRPCPWKSSPRGLARAYRSLAFHLLVGAPRPCMASWRYRDVAFPCGCRRNCAARKLQRPRLLQRGGGGWGKLNFRMHIHLPLLTANEGHPAKRAPPAEGEIPAFLRFRTTKSPEKEPPEISDGFCIAINDILAAIPRGPRSDHHTGRRYRRWTARSAGGDPSSRPGRSCPSGGSWRPRWSAAAR